MPPKRPVPPKQAPPKTVQEQKVQQPSEIRYRVTSRNQYNDSLIFGCKFEKGVWEGQLTDWQLTMFKEWGYTCTAIENN